MAEPTHDEMYNNLVATGGVAALLQLGIQGTSGRASAEIEMVDGVGTNRITVRFPFLQSPYRVTVERVPDDA